MFQNLLLLRRGRRSSRHLNLQKHPCDNSLIHDKKRKRNGNEAVVYFELTNANSIENSCDDFYSNHIAKRLVRMRAGWLWPINNKLGD
jgi:hypothetical protein